MKNLITLLDDIKRFDKNCVLAIGMFDGLHMGHRRVIDAAKKLSKKYNATVGVLTFSPHPSRVVYMGRPPVDMLFNADARARMFKDAGAEKVFVKKFDKRFAARTSRSFEKFLSDKFPNLKAIVTGENFLFGKGAEGNSKTLADISQKNGWEYVAVEGVCLEGGERISSTLMRRALRAGDLKLYKKMAGADYECYGEVKGGRKLGRKMGFPTLNLPWNPDCKPPFGVYVVELKKGNKTYRGVANYGVNPTVGKTEPLVETNLFEKVSFGAGSKISVRFLKFLRTEKKFSSLDELAKQISKDKTAAQKFFK